MSLVHEWAAQFVRDTTAHTSEAYRISKTFRLRYFVDYVEAEHAGDPRKVTRADVEAFQKWVLDHVVKNGKTKDQKVSPNFARSVCVVVRRFCAWLVETRRLLVDPAAGVDLPKRARRIPRGILAPDEIKKLLRVRTDKRAAPTLRDRAVLEVLYGSGIRPRELHNLNAGDVDVSRAVVFVRQGKGRKDRVVPMGRRAAKAVAEYLTHAHRQLIAHPAEPALFVDDHGRRITGGTVNKMIQARLRRVAIQKRTTAYGLRHTFATHLLDRGANLRHIQAMLGHAAIKNTEIYTHVSLERLADVHRRAHPRGRKHRRRLTFPAAGDTLQGNDSIDDLPLFGPRKPVCSSP